MSVLYWFSFCTKNGQWPDNSILAESFWKAIVFQYSFLMKIQYICHVLENGDDYVEINGLLIVNFQELVPSRPSLRISTNIILHNFWKWNSSTSLLSLGVHLKDLILLHTALPDRTDDGQLNLRKMGQLSVIFAELMQLQNTKPPLETNVDLVNMLRVRFLH